jgi:hypothetical protein
MLVRFSIKKSSLQSMSAAECRRLLRMWTKYGSFVSKGSSLQGDAILQLCQVPESRRLLKLAVLTHERWPIVLDDTADWLELNPGDEVLDENKIGLYALGRNETGLYQRASAGEVEFVELGAVDQSERFEEAERLSKQDISRGSSTREVWSKRFLPLTIGAKFVAVADRFALKSELHGVSNNGLRQFLKFALESGFVGQIQVYASDVASKTTGAKRPVSILDGVNNLKVWLESLGLASRARIVISVVPDQKFSKECHDRYVRFGNKYLDIGTGLEVLGGDTVFRRSTCTLKFDHENDDVNKRSSIELSLGSGANAKFEL